MIRKICAKIGDYVSRCAINDAQQTGNKMTTHEEIHFAIAVRPTSVNSWRKIKLLLNGQSVSVWWRTVARRQLPVVLDAILVNFDHSSFNYWSDQEMPIIGWGDGEWSLKECGRKMSRNHGKTSKINLSFVHNWLNSRSHSKHALTLTVLKTYNTIKYHVIN